MKTEKFSLEDGKTGYRIIGATFASSRNTNGAYFDPVEVFSLDNPPEQFNFAHKDYETDYSTGTKVTANPTGSIDGKMLRFSWDLETTNENFVALIDSENFGGFSPELFPKNKPIKSEAGERFYRQGDLQWKNTAILAKDQKPGFVGANEYQLEKFEAFEDVVIKQEDDLKTELPKLEAEEKSEKFYSWVSVGCYCTTPDDKIGKVVSITQSEGEMNTYTVKMIDGTTQVFTDSSDNQTEVLERLSMDDLADYLFTQSQPKEGFEEKNDPETPPVADLITEDDKKDQEKFDEVKKETERFNQIAKAKSAIDDTKHFQHGAGDEGGNQSSEINAEAKQSLMQKLFL